jgi:hypothetical protein
MNKIRKALAALGAAALLTLTGCGALIETDSATQALWYQDGDFEAPVFKGCIGGNVYERHGFGDAYFRYPTGDRTWSFTGREGSDTAPLSVKTKDKQEMIQRGFIKFNLTSDCEALKTFHERIGLAGNAYFNEDGTMSPGWVTFLEKYLAVPVNTVMDNGGIQHNWLDLYNVQKSQNAFEAYVQQNLKAEIDKTLGTPNLVAVTLVALETPQPPDALLESLRKSEQQVTEARGREAAAAADEKAQIAENRRLKAQFGGVKECVAVLGREACYRLELQKGPNPPQYIPDGSSVIVDPKR